MTILLTDDVVAMLDRRNAELTALRAEVAKLHKALHELVALKDIADLRDYNLLYAQTTGSLDKAKELDAEYRSRKQQAWRDARAALAAQEEKR